MLSLLLAVPSCIYSFWHGVIPTSYFIFNDFYTCFTNFLSRLNLALTVAHGEMPYVRSMRTSASIAGTRTRMRIVPEVVTCMCNQR